MGMVKRVSLGSTPSTSEVLGIVEDAIQELNMKMGGYPACNSHSCVLLLMEDQGLPMSCWRY